MSLNMGTYFLKMTAVTVKFLSSFSVLCRNSFGRLAISCQFFILLKNSIKLGGEQKITFNVHVNVTVKCPFPNIQIQIILKIPSCPKFPSISSCFFSCQSKASSITMMTFFIVVLKCQTQTGYHTDEERYK